MTLRQAAAATLTMLLAMPAGAQPAPPGRSLAAGCANCHGTNGHARGEFTALAGLPAERIVATMAEFKSGARSATIMHQIAKGYSDEQVRLIADYFAGQGKP